MTSGEIHVRDALAGEEEAIRALTIAAYGEYEAIMAPQAWRGLRYALRRALRSTAEADRIVALIDGRIVGSVMLFSPGKDVYGEMGGELPWPEVRLLAVEPEQRGRGVGRALMGECVDRARRRGARFLGLHTSESMRDAIRMYRGMGFERAPDFDFRPPGGELVEAYALRLLPDPEVPTTVG